MELGDFIAVQARRGDYLQLAAYHGLASDAYFRRALDVLDPSHDYPVVIFTDDTTGWVPKWAEGRQNIVITPSQIPDARENLVLMSKARRFVISNSSFGWWGAWLASDTDPLVIAPRPWFAERSKDTTDLLPPRWLTMDLRAL